MNAIELKSGAVIRGPALPEPIEVLVVTKLGEMFKVDGRGPTSTRPAPAQLAALIRPVPPMSRSTLPTEAPFDGNPLHFKVGIQAAWLGMAYEYDPYFAVSIARVDPLPHQIEAVYD